MLLTMLPVTSRMPHKALLPLLSKLKLKLLLKLLNLLSHLLSQKKKSAFDGLGKTALIALLKQFWKHEEEVANANLDDEDEQESKASSEAFVSKKDDPFYTYDQARFCHNPISNTPDLVDD